LIERGKVRGGHGFAGLTFRAILMAVSFWALLGDLDPAWWLPKPPLFTWHFAVGKSFELEKCES
jgi:hypothetical protein